MVRKCAGAALLAGLVLSTGCSLCPEGYLDDYATVGGKWPRGNPTHGRVGSILSDAGAISTSETVVYGDSVGQDYYYEEAPYDQTIEPFNAPEVPGTILEAPIGQ